ncbi:MAG: hypothetical protein L3J54_07840 [Draconibacterium sp.]|nr:hypothetical protein [Draconibacterium sp.]
MQENKKKLDVEDLMDEVLTTEPGFSLPDNFAEMVAVKVSRKFAWEQYFIEFLIYLSVFIGMGIVSAAITLFLYDVNWKQWLVFIVSNIGLVAGVSIITIFILFADRVLLRYFLFRGETEII